MPEPRSLVMKVGRTRLRQRRQVARRPGKSVSRRLPEPPSRPLYRARLQSKRPAMPRILLVAATTGYQTRSFAEAARRRGIDVQLATDRCHILEDPWGDRAIAVRFEEPEKAAEILSGIGGSAVDGIVAV